MMLSLLTSSSVPILIKKDTNLTSVIRCKTPLLDEILSVRHGILLTNVDGRRPRRCSDTNDRSRMASYNTTDIICPPSSISLFLLLSMSSTGDLLEHRDNLSSGSFQSVHKRKVQECSDQTLCSFASPRVDGRQIVCPWSITSEPTLHLKE